MVLSAVDAMIEDTTFANLSSTALLILEGGCGGEAGDYTEGPFSRNIVLRNNHFLNTATTSRRSQVLDINSLASVQIGGCTPIGVCGMSGGMPPTMASAREVAPLEGGVLRIVGFTLPQPAVLSFLGFFSASIPPQGIQMALYADTWLDKGVVVSTGHPTKRLAVVDSSAFKQDDSVAGWWRARAEGLILPNGSYYVAHYFPAGEQWHTVQASGVSQQWKEDWQGGLPLNLIQNCSVWSTAAGLSIAAEWNAKDDWCDTGGTLPPPTRHDNNNPNEYDKCLLEPGQVLQGGKTFAQNIVIESNEFVAPLQDPFGDAWRNNHLNLGGIDGLVLRNNRLTRPGGFDPEVSGADIVLYSNKQVHEGGNSCVDGEGKPVPCVSKNASRCSSVTKC